jgi:hypothetical protein
MDFALQSWWVFDLIEIVQYLPLSIHCSNGNVHVDNHPANGRLLTPDIELIGIVQ